jgi:hypothetical protein
MTSKRSRARRGPPPEADNAEYGWLAEQTLAEIAKIEQLAAELGVHAPAAASPPVIDAKRKAKRQAQRQARKRTRR